MKMPSRFPIILVLILTTACSQLPPISQQLTYNNSRYIKKDETNNRKVIVFVHGVLGNATSSWTNETTKTYWPDLIAKDKAFVDGDVYVYEYPSPQFDRSLSVNEVAEAMRARLEKDKVLSYPEIIFLSHSMGGLVTRDFLVKYRNYASKVKMAYFFSTPTTGSPMAMLASAVSKNTQLGSMYPMKSDSYLADLQRNWLAAQLGIRSFCAYEMKPTYGIMIVDQASASNLCTEPLDPILEDHISIVKPSDTNSDAYIAFLNAYNTSAKNVGIGGSPHQVERELKQPTFSEYVDKIYFSLGEGGMSIGYPLSELEKSPKEPFLLNGFSPVKIYVKNGQPYADVKVYGGNGFPPIEIRNNELINKPSNWDFNSNERGMEIVDNNYRPMYQFFYKSPSHIVVNGVFTFPNGLILANEKGAIINPNLPTTFTLTKIFKYPSWKYPGELEETTDRGLK